MRDKATRSGVIRRLAPPENMPGFALWQVGEAGGVMVCLPDLVNPTPEITHLYMDRILANATGRCPRCEAVASDPTSSAPGILLHHAGVVHRSGCPTLKLELESRQWFDPRALDYLNGGGDG